MDRFSQRRQNLSAEHDRGVGKGIPVVQSAQQVGLERVREELCPRARDQCQYPAARSNRSELLRARAGVARERRKQASGGGQHEGAPRTALVFVHA
jgi:hypothetical protein